MIAPLCKEGIPTVPHSAAARQAGQCLSIRRTAAHDIDTTASHSGKRTAPPSAQEGS